MNVKSEKGYTGIDIAISIVVLFIFVSLIAMLAYHLNSSAKEIELKSQATEIAVKEIEELKNKNFEEIKQLEKAQKQDAEKIRETGFYKKVKIEDYNESNPNKEKDRVKKVIVTIQYKFKNEPQEIKLSAIVSKEN